MKKKIIGISMCFFILLTGCSRATTNEKWIRYGTTAYGTAMGNAGLDPHTSYMGWSAVRYGVGETLFKFNESMALEPWLTKDATRIDDYTMIITLRDDSTFSNGKKVTAEAVQKCFTRLLSKHDRAPVDLDIKEMQANGQELTIVTNTPNPTLLNYLSDPYGAIIDVDEGVDENFNVVGTGPYKAVKVSTTNIELRPNDVYWGEEKPKVDKISVLSITDGDTLTMSLQSKEIEMAQGLPYISKKLFVEDPQYTISSSDTSRVYQIAFNFESSVTRDKAIREAISYAIDKEQFTSTLLNGNGSKADGAFPSNFAFGNEAIITPQYNLEEAKRILAEAGYQDLDQDGYLEKEGNPLTIRWLTYTSRQELPLLAEYALEQLKTIGIRVEMNATDNHLAVLETGNYDVYASAFVAAPTGDPQYYFTSHMLANSVYNTGSYVNLEVQSLITQLSTESNIEKRTQLAIMIQQKIIDDAAYVYVAHLNMSLVMQNNIIGFTAHPCDYYEITSQIDMVK